MSMLFSLFLYKQPHFSGFFSTLSLKERENLHFLPNNLQIKRRLSMDSSTVTKSSTLTRLCFIEEDDGLASLVEPGAGFARDDNNSLNSRPIYNGFQSLRNLASVQCVPSSKIGNGRFYHVEQQEHPPTHFLDSCFLCQKSLGDRDIFMYRGDTPFCSEECRQEQIEMDEAKEMSLNSTKALRNKEQTASTSPNKTTQTYSLCSSTVAAA